MRVNDEDASNRRFRLPRGSSANRKLSRKEWELGRRLQPYSIGRSSQVVVQQQQVREDFRNRTRHFSGGTTVINDNLYRRHR
jgi:hypothetical protein